MQIGSLIPARMIKLAHAAATLPPFEMVEVPDWVKIGRSRPLEVPVLGSPIDVIGRELQVELPRRPRCSISRRHDEMVVLAPRAVAHVIDATVQIRGRVALAREKRVTMIELVRQLVEGGMDAQIMNNERHGNSWTITVRASTKPVRSMSGEPGPPVL